MVKKVLKYEIQEYSGTSWQSLSSRQDRVTAIGEANRRASLSKQSRARVIEHTFDSETGTFDTQLVYGSDAGGAAAQAQPGKPSVAAAPPRRAPAKRPSHSMARILVTLVVIAVAGLALTGGADYLLENGFLNFLR